MLFLHNFFLIFIILTVKSSLKVIVMKRKRKKIVTNCSSTGRRSHYHWQTRKASLSGRWCGSVQLHFGEIETSCHTQLVHQRGACKWLKNVAVLNRSCLSECCEILWHFSYPYFYPCNCTTCHQSSLNSSIVRYSCPCHKYIDFQKNKYSVILHQATMFR